MVSFTRLPTLAFPAQNRLTLDGLEAIGQARRRRKQREQEVNHRNRMFNEDKRRFNAELARRKKQEDRAFQLAQQRAGARTMRPSFADLNFLREVTSAQADALPAGTRFVDRDGNMREAAGSSPRTMSANRDALLNAPKGAGPRPVQPGAISTSGRTIDFNNLTR